MVFKMKNLSIVKGLESVAICLLMFSFITGCCKVGKGVKITDNLNRVPTPYPVIDIETTTSTTDAMMKVTRSEEHTSELQSRI